MTFIRANRGQEPSSHLDTGAHLELPELIGKSVGSLDVSIHRGNG